MSSPARSIPSRHRRRIVIKGQVQGVGFRPYVYRLALDLGLMGFVRNSGNGVEIEAQGGLTDLDNFCHRLKHTAPPLARVDSITIDTVAAHPHERPFRIESTRQDSVRTCVAPDTSVCTQCLAELFDPHNRRYRYPFINCTHCGPRYTLTTALPYDRPNTTMAKFQQCESCAQEYASPLSRRFHAQPNACALCGPQARLLDRDGNALYCADPIAESLTRLLAGQILAIKGLGGFHIACDARNAAAVKRLRDSKQRERKPLALMTANVQSIARLAELNPVSIQLLESKERPIVLCEKKPACDALLPAVADEVPSIGLMLPYTPLHYLLFHEAAGRPDGIDWLGQAQSLLLVMTSANPNGEPLVRDDAEAVQRLYAMVDGFLVHNRDIAVRCDDSVIRSDGQPVFVRRARGFTPQALNLSRTGPSVLACGARHKNSICLTRDDQAFLSQHIGDLDNKASCVMFSETVSHLLASLHVEPQIVAHDLHPDFFSTNFATRFAAEGGLKSVAVQHHHAHAAAVMAEHGLREPAFALTLDGVGLGVDGGLWGGELLRVHGSDVERLGHLGNLPLPGGERAAREPWRMAAAVLHIMGRGDEIEQRFPLQQGADVVTEMLRRDFLCPPTSSAGRWFDAAAGLLGISRVSSYEAQAAMKLEKFALEHPKAPAMRDGFKVRREKGLLVLDLLPLFATLAELRDAAIGASLFHSTFVFALTSWIIEATQKLGPHPVVLAGGCFVNRLLSDGLSKQLADHGFVVYQARDVPPNDGGISLGQAWVAMQSQGAS